MRDPALDLMTDAEFALAVIDRWFTPEYLTKVAALAQKRMMVLSDFIPLTAFMFTEDLDYTGLVPDVQRLKVGAFALYALHDVLTDLAPFDVPQIKDALERVAETYTIEIKTFLKAARLAITGRVVATPLYETIEVLGRERAAHRVYQFAQFTDLIL